MLKKVLRGIVAVSSMTIIFSGIEYLLYSFIIKNSKLIIPGLVLLLFILAISINILNKLAWFGKGINSLFAFVSILIGLGVLKLLLPL